MTEPLPKAESGAFESVSVVDHVPRIVGYQAVQGLPLIVVVSYARADVLAPWFQHLYAVGLLTALVVLVFVLGSVLLMVQARNLANKTDILEATLENMT